MDVQTDKRTTENIIFDQGVRKYVRVKQSWNFTRFYITDHNYNWPPFRVELLQVTGPASANTYTF